MTLSLVVRTLVLAFVLLVGSLISVAYATTAHASMAGDINCEIGGILDQHGLPGPSGCDDEETPPTDLCPNDDGIQTTTPCPSDTNGGTGGENNGGNNGGTTGGNNGGSQGGTTSGDTTTGGGTPLPNGGGIAPDVTGGGSSTSGTSTPSSGTVLGTTTINTPTLPVATSTVTICGDQPPYLTTYMRIGQHNDVAEVMKLQTFLNMHMNLSLPVTGFFGQLTHDAVNAFQLKHSQEVLLPWVAHGLPSEQTPTGYVYKTTQRMINNLACSMNLPLPQLP